MRIYLERQLRKSKNLKKKVSLHTKAKVISLAKHNIIAYLGRHEIWFYASSICCVTS